MDPSNIDRDDIDWVFEEGGTLYHIDSNKLDLRKITDDDNWNDEESKSYQYEGIVPVGAIINVTHFDIF